MSTRPLRLRGPAAWAAPALALACLSFAAGSASAQDTRFGVRGGVNFSTLQNEPSLGSGGFGYRQGLVAGAFFTWPLGWFDLQPEVLYTSKGAALDLEGIDSKLVLDYLEVPVLARWRLGQRLYVAAGPAVAWRLKAASRTKFSGATEEIDLDDDVKGYDVGVVGAVGVRFGKVVVDGRYTHGLIDIDSDTSDEVTVRNRAITISAGVGF
jgi:hypothetical protein